MKEHRGISRAVRLINSILDNGLVLLLLLGLAYGCYALWDSQNLAQEATAEQYAVYKPQEDTLGFAELQALNEDVIGWMAHPLIIRWYRERTTGSTSTRVQKVPIPSQGRFLQMLPVTRIFGILTRSCMATIWFRT